MKYIKNLMTNIICLFKFNLVKDYDAFIDHVDKLNARIDVAREQRDGILNRLVDLEFKVDDLLNILSNRITDMDARIDDVKSDVKTIIQVHLMDFNDSSNDVENSIKDIKDDIKEKHDILFAKCQSLGMSSSEVDDTIDTINKELETIKENAIENNIIKSGWIRSINKEIKDIKDNGINDNV